MSLDSTPHLFIHLWIIWKKKKILPASFEAYKFHFCSPTVPSSLVRRALRGGRRRKLSPAALMSTPLPHQSQQEKVSAVTTVRQMTLLCCNNSCLQFMETTLFMYHRLFNPCLDICLFSLTSTLLSSFTLNLSSSFLPLVCPDFLLSLRVR